MPEKTVKRRLKDCDAALADDDGPIFSTVAKLVEALDLAVPYSRDAEAKEEALRLGRELLRGTKYQGDLTERSGDESPSTAGVTTPTRETHR